MGQTPNYDIYYPDPSGIPKRADFQEMSETVDAALGAVSAEGKVDTGWVNWTTGVPAGWSIQYRILTGWCYVSVNGTSVSLPNGNTTVATGLTSAVLGGSPPGGAWFTCYCGGQPGMSALSLGGNVLVRSPGATNGTHGGSIIFPIGFPEA